MLNAPNNFILNSLRTLTMIEKAIDRLIRQNFSTCAIKKKDLALNKKA